MSSVVLSATWNWRSRYWQRLIRLVFGAQFGGKYLAHDVRIIRLPRHGASCPVGLGVSCSADRNIKCKINKEGIWIEKLDSNPGELIPAELRKAGEGDVVKINLNQPMENILKELTKYPVSTRLSLNGTIIVGRDIAHAKLKERLDRGEDLPQYIKDHPSTMAVLPRLRRVWLAVQWARQLPDVWTPT